MSKEAALQNPAELTGMSPDQQQKSAELLIAKREAHEQVSEVEYAASIAVERATQPHPMDPNYDTKLFLGTIATPTLAVVGGARIVAAEFKAHRADNRAEKHYKRNQAAYQEQAIKDAHDAGVEINR